MKKINELTEEEGKEILKFVFPDKDYQFLQLSFEKQFNEDGNEWVTMGFRSIIGILYLNDYPDRCLLHFDDTKVVLWLYKNGFEILEQLEQNQNLTKLEQHFDEFIYGVHSLRIRKELVSEEVKSLITLEYVLKNLKELEDRYYSKLDC